MRTMLGHKIQPLYRCLRTYAICSAHRNSDGKVERHPEDTILHAHTSQRPFPTHHSLPSLLPHPSASSTVHSPTRAHRSSLRRSHSSSSSFVGPGGGPVLARSCARSRSMSDVDLPADFRCLGVASPDVCPAGLADSATIVRIAPSSTREKYAGVSGT